MALMMTIEPNDSLTGLYNKLATKNLINEYINNNPMKMRFIIIDIFNFNKINEIWLQLR